MKLNKKAAETAVKIKVADPLGMDVAEAAMGIVEVSNSNMLGSMRVGSVERGYDPREFTTIAYGGAGPVVAGKLARDLNCSKVIIPMHPGIFSAIGMLVTDIRFDFMKTWITPLAGIDLDKLNEHYRSLEKEATATIPERYSKEIELVRMADLRYVGQNYETLTPVPGGALKADDISRIITNFNVEHERQFGHSKADEPVELVALRTTILGKIRRPKFKKSQKGNMQKSLKGHRMVYFEKFKDFISCSIYDREQLEVGHGIEGPAIIEEYDSTTVIYPEQSANLDSLGNIIIKTM
jgi:N-methylhydantoinase A